MGPGIGPAPSTDAERLYGRGIKKPGCGCMGCLGSVATTVVAVIIGYILLFPWTLHIGGRWTPLLYWDGVGRIRDSSGAEYGLYIRFNPQPDLNILTGNTFYPSRCCEVRGPAQVCTASGGRFRFDMVGHISGVWLSTDGSKVDLGFGEHGRTRSARTFELSGVWRGPNLVLDDDKSMFIHFLPGGNMTPAPTYSAPVPEKHAKATLSSGTLRDFDSICAALAAAPAH